MSRYSVRQALALCAALWIHSAAAEPRSTADGVYTKAQAKAGEKLYAQHCLVCHDKNYFKPVLARWSGQPVSLLFDVMSGSMPESNPGGLLPDEYVKILAYIFSRSRYPAGEGELDHEDGALAEITIEDS